MPYRSLLTPTLLLGLALATLACAQQRSPAPVTHSPLAITGAPRWSPPSDWRTQTSVEIEANLPTAPVAPTTDALADLSRGLGEAPAIATRAALLLARTESAAGSEALLERLEQRQSGPDRADDAGDSTAARALGHRPLAERTAERLAALCAGPRPHPDLEVRVECAAAALSLGRADGIPYLLAVLRIDTDEAKRRGEDLTDSPTTAWARGRAAEVLCAHLGLEHRVWTDAPLEVRAERALELERRVAAGQRAPR
ncbi:MAG: hypothetical protein AAFZ65_05930 [Planctomycetota bacterium]